MKRLYAAGSALALTLALAACGEPSRPSERAAAPATEVTEAQAREGLTALGITEGDGASWDSDRFEDGVITIEGVRSDEGAEAVTAEQIIVSAPRVEGEGANFDRLEIRGLSSDMPDLAMALESIVVDRPGPALAQLIADVVNSRTEETGYEAPSQRVSDYTFAEISASGFEASEEGEGAGTFGRIALENFDGERLGRMILSNMAFSFEDPEAGPINFNIGEMSMDGLDASIVQAAVDAGGAEDEENMGAFLGALAGYMGPIGVYDAFAMRDLEFNGAGLVMAMPTMVAEIEALGGGEHRQTLSMPSFTLEVAEAAGPMAQMRMGLEMLGYERLDMSMQSNALYDENTDRMVTEGENYFELADGLRVEFEQDVSGLQAYADAYGAFLAQAAAEGTLTEELADPQALAAVYEPLMIHSMTMRLEDLSLLERAINAAAEAQGAEPELMRQQAAGMVAMGLAMAGSEIPPGLAAELGGALSSFITEGGALVVAMNPDAPVSMAALMSPDPQTMDISVFGLSVTHEAP